MGGEKKVCYTYSAGEIVNQIVDILDADAQSDDILGHLSLLSGLGVDARVAHAAGHADQGVDTAKADADAPEAGGLDDPLGECDVARLKRQHGAGAAGHGPVQVVLRVRLETRVADPEAVRLEELGNLLGVGLLLLHADRERLDAAHEEERVVGAQAAAGAVDDEVHLVGQGGIVAGDHAGHDVVVAGEILGAGFVHDVGAEIQGVRQHGREHGVVHDDERLLVGLVGHPCDARDVDNLDERVRGRLQEDHGRLVVDQLPHAVGVGGVDVVDDDTLVGREVGEQAVGAAVQVVAGDDLVAGSKQAGDDVQGTHARADSQGTCGIHDLGEVALEMGTGGIAGSSVIVLAASVGRRLLEGRGLVDGDARGAILILGLGVDELGGQGVSSSAVRGAGRRGGRGKIVTVEVNAGRDLL